MAAKPEISLEVISPQRAREMLALNTHNRRIQPELVDYLAGCMERGEWVINGENLKFLDSGTLVDGQHRLSAVVRSGVTIETLVVRGIAEEARDAVDTGRSRGVSDTLVVEGFERAVFLASAIKALHRFTGADFTYGKAAAPSADQALQLLEEAPELERSTFLAS